MRSGVTATECSAKLVGVYRHQDSPVYTTSHTLLQRIRQEGRPADWDRFVNLYTPLLYYWARRTGLQEADTSDLVQDVMALMVQKLPDFEYDRQKNFRG